MQLTLTIDGDPGPHLSQHRLHGPLGCHQTLNTHSLNINLTDEGGVSIGTVEISNLRGRPALRVTDSDQRESSFDFLDQRSPVLKSGHGGALAYTDNYSVASGTIHAQIDAVGGEMISDTTTVVEAAGKDGFTYIWTKNEGAESPSAAPVPDATGVAGLDPTNTLCVIYCGFEFPFTVSLRTFEYENPTRLMSKALRLGSSVIVADLDRDAPRPEDTEEYATTIQASLKAGRFDFPGAHVRQVMRRPQDLDDFGGE